MNIYTLFIVVAYLVVPGLILHLLLIFFFKQVGYRQGTKLFTSLKGTVTLAYIKYEVRAKNNQWLCPYTKAYNKGLLKGLEGG